MPGVEGCLLERRPSVGGETAALVRKPGGTAMAPAVDDELCGCRAALYGGVREACGPALLGTELESLGVAKFEVARGLRVFFTGGFA